MAYIVAGMQARPELVDALRAYSHFLVDNNGTDLQFSYEKYAKDDPSGKAAVDSAMRAMHDAAVRLSNEHGKVAEHFLIESGGISVGSSSTDYPYPATENWQKAIGAHHIWLEGAVDVTTTKAGDRTFAVRMTLHAQDRYNFNPGGADVATGTPDDVNGVFELTGLGTEFMSRAVLTRALHFSVPAGAGTEPAAAGAGFETVEQKHLAVAGTGPLATHMTAVLKSPGSTSAVKGLSAFLQTIPLAKLAHELAPISVDALAALVKALANGELDAWEANGRIFLAVGEKERKELDAKADIIGYMELATVHGDADLRWIAHTDLPKMTEEEKNVVVARLSPAARAQLHTIS